MFVSKVARYNFFGPKKLQVSTARVSIMEAFVKKSFNLLTSVKQSTVSTKLSSTSKQKTLCDQYFLFP